MFSRWRRFSEEELTILFEAVASNPEHTTSDLSVEIMFELAKRINKRWHKEGKL